ncbi:UBXN4 isoform 4 [Pongo abelii]|uniref:UBXN4 isoform 4 n=1 Tax=Pongo abelii TaxID=9601 RepID=A0A2J8TF58_PONAB|nr:UBXN4 isoform 4 [Pongo abelii]
MLWFQGAIPAAIATAKRSGAVFVVFVAGDDEQSTQMAASWEDDKVTEASSNSFVAIKIDTKSEACLQFSQICILSVKNCLYIYIYLPSFWLIYEI